MELQSSVLRAYLLVCGVFKRRFYSAAGFLVQRSEVRQLAAALTPWLAFSLILQLRYCLKSLLIY